MNTLLRLAAAIAVILLIPTTAQAAKHYHHHYRHQQRPMHVDQYPAMAYPAYQPTYQPQQKSHRWSRKFADATFARYADGNIEYDSGRIVNHPAGCPGRAFCGCGVCIRLGIPIATCKKLGLFLASNYIHKFPRTSMAAGMVAARSGHVMYIERLDANGNAVVYDPNSGGHATRVHTRSLAGYTIVNPHGSRYAGL